MKSSLLFGAFVLLFALACHTTNDITRTDQEFLGGSTIENPDNSITLVEHLRKVSGVSVRGNGPDASVVIRGVSSITSGVEPLFVVDGIALSGGLTTATQLVPVESIRSITVLKNPSETGIYGVRGANGVIEIALKH